MIASAAENMSMTKAEILLKDQSQRPAPRCGRQCSWLTLPGRVRCPRHCRHAKHHPLHCYCMRHFEGDGFYPPWMAAEARPFPARCFVFEGSLNGGATVNFPTSFVALATHASHAVVGTAAQDACVGTTALAKLERALRARGLKVGGQSDGDGDLRDHEGHEPEEEHVRGTDAGDCQQLPVPAVPQSQPQPSTQSQSQPSTQSQEPDMNTREDVLQRVGDARFRAFLQSMRSMP